MRRNYMMTAERDRQKSRARVPVSLPHSTNMMAVQLNQLGQFECRRSRHRSREGCARISRKKEAPTSANKQQSPALEASVVCGTRTVKISARMSFVKSPVSLAGVLVALAALSTFSAQYSHCDTPTSSQSSASLLRRSQRTIDKQTGESSASGRERFLSSLADSIERQHFNAINPVRSLVGQQRPSKYDSGNEFEPIQTSAWLAKSSQRLSEAPRSKSSARGSQSKNADESMQHIMRMHEHANMIAAHHGAPSSQAPPQTADKPLDWRELSRAPARVASSLMSRSKVVGRVFSRIVPLMGAKSADSKPTNTSANASYPSILLQPFIARSNGAKAQTATHLLHHLSRRPPATVAPQTAFLASPSKSQRQQSTKSGRQMASTQASTALGGLADNVPSSAPTRLDPPDHLMADSSSISIAPDTSSSQVDASLSAKKTSNQPQDNLARITSPTRAGLWLKNSANQFAHNYFQDSLRGLLTLSQLPILPGGQLSTAPSVLEKGGRFGKDSNKTSNATDDSQRKKIINELVRYAYIISTSARRKKDPLKALLPPRGSLLLANRKGIFGQRSVRGPVSKDKDQSLIGQASHKFKTYLSPANRAKPRGVMWDVATDPSLVVTLFHLLERASVALPLGFLLMPFVQMTRNPFSGLGGLNLASILPPRASHRSIDYEELAKRLDVVDKMLSRALRPTHREQSFMGR